MNEPFVPRMMSPDEQVDASAVAFALCKMLSQVIAALPPQHQRNSLTLMHSDLDRPCGMNTVQPVQQR